MNRIVINMDAQGLFTVYSDEPIELFVVCDHTPNDRVYQMEVETGVEKVRQQLGADTVDISTTAISWVAGMVHASRLRSGSWRW